MSVLARSFPIWGRNVLSFSLLNVIAYAPLLVYGVFAFPTRRGALPLADHADFMSYSAVLALGACLVSYIAPLAVIHGVLEQLRGRPASFAGCLRVYLTRLLPSLGVGLVVGFLAFLFFFVGAAFVGLVGQALDAPVVALLALLPPAFVGCMYWVAVPVAAAERHGILDTLRRSAELTRGSRSAIFVVVLLAVVFQVSPFIVARAAAPHGVGAVGGWGVILLTVSLGSYGAVAAGVAYHDLRISKDGVGVDDLVRVFA
ncbi:MAG: hypothetical protein L6Q95_06295 [Planctomycetes bacterium]|nr:hypothetical protein [Planctomycetota bacterium]